MLVDLLLMMSSTESAKLQFLQWPPEAVKASQCYKHVQSVHTVSYSSGGTRQGSFGFSAISPVRQLHLLSHSSPHSPDLSKYYANMASASKMIGFENCTG